MKTVLLMSAALAAMTTVMAVNEPIVTATDSGEVKMGERDCDAGRWRVALSGNGRFGQELKSVLGKEHIELYSVGLDVQYNLMSRDSFNLWLGLGYSYTPEQEAMDEKWHESDVDYSYSGHVTVDIEWHDFRLMLIPEWQVTESLALGVRLGIGVGFYDCTVKASDHYQDAYESESWSASYSEDDTLIQGIVGLQATYLFTDYIGVQAYCDMVFGNELDTRVEGEKVGSFDPSGVAAGVAIVGQF